MGKVMAAKLRGYVGLLEDVRKSIERGWNDNALIVLNGVIANLERNALEIEWRGRDWNEQRKAELAELGILEGEPRGLVPPRIEPYF